MISGQGRALLAQAGVALAIAALIAGCGDNYRPTVTPVYSTGPAAQPTSYVVVVSTTGVSTDGVVTLTGTGSSPENIRKAIQITMDTDGVHKVISTLQVKE